MNIRYAIFIFFTFFLCDSDLALATEATITETPSWLEYVLNRIPAETIAWIIAVIGLLNGISEGLGKLEDAIYKYAKKTSTEADDKIAAVLHVVVTALEKFVGFAKRIIDFFTAKPKKK